MIGSDHQRDLSARLRLLKPHGGIPRLFAFTDPTRGAAPEHIARRLPRGAVLVFRAFGAANALRTARLLRRITKRRGVWLLIGADARLAAGVFADGVHLPERLVRQAGRIKRTQRFRVVTATAHAGAPASHYRDVDVVVISPIFPTKSAGSGAPMGLRRARAMMRAIGKPGIALGGLSGRTFSRALSAGFHGIAGVDLFKT